MGDLVPFPGPKGPLKKILSESLDQISHMRDPNSYLGKLDQECRELGLINQWDMPYNRNMTVEGHSLSLSFGFLSPLIQLPVARVVSEPLIAEEEHQSISRLFYQGFRYEGLEIKVFSRFGETKVRKLAERMQEFLGENVKIYSDFSWFWRNKK